MTLIVISLHNAVIKSVLSDHLSYVALFHCPIERSYKTGLTVEERKKYLIIYSIEEPSWPWSYDSWIYNYICNQCLSPLTLWVPTPLSRCVIDTILCDTVCPWLVVDRWFYPGAPVSFSNKTDCHEIAERLLA